MSRVSSAAKIIVGPEGKRKLGPPSSNSPNNDTQSPPRYAISKESVQQKWIDEMWFRKQLSTCLFAMSVPDGGYSRNALSYFYYGNNWGKVCTIIKSGHTTNAEISLTIRPIDETVHYNKIYILIYVCYDWIYDLKCFSTYNQSYILTFQAWIVQRTFIVHVWMEEVVFVRVANIWLDTIWNACVPRVITALSPKIRVLLFLYTTNITSSVDDNS